MTYIINPIWFYLADLVSELDFISAAAVVCCLIGIVCLVVACAICLDCNMDTTFPKKGIKACVVIMIISIIVSILTPSKETMITMMVAKFATYENAAWTLDTLKSAVDYIIEAIGSI